MEIASVQCPLATINSLSCCHNNYSTNIKVIKPTALRKLNFSLSPVFSVCSHRRCFLEIDICLSLPPLHKSLEKNLFKTNKIIPKKGDAKNQPHRLIAPFITWYINCAISSNGSVFQKWRHSIAGGRISKFSAFYSSMTCVTILQLP